MRSFRHILGAAALVVATTVGAGMFALPYVVSRVGWLPALVLLAGLSVFVMYAHELHARVLVHFGEHRRLPGLARTELGAFSFWPAFTAVLLGVVFSLVAYLLLAARFLHILIPTLPENIALVLFWMAVSLPLLARLRAFVQIETIGTLLKAGLISVIFLAAARSLGTLPQLPIIGEGSLSEAFGPALFALAGWTAVAPVTEYLKKRSGLRYLRSALFVGTVVSAVLYVCFVWGAVGLGGSITRDTASGLVRGSPA
ncbi:MAG TPA: aromatic amino acid transport family protein, partial [Candidatus Paceibacterota bacterium]|nr:aromatic amino acid transport family protein [Candidatus Paceibacterota bacterium]